MANYYTTVAGAGAKNGSDWDNAYDHATFQSTMTSKVAGDIMYIYSGTYTASSNHTFWNDGTNTDHIHLVGISDQDLMTEAQGDDRPLFEMGTYAFDCDNYWTWKNLRINAGVTTGDRKIRCDTDGIVINCKITVASTNTSHYAFYFGGTGGTLIDTEISNPLARGVYGNGFLCQFCYIHDCAVYGIYAGGGAYTFLNSIFDTCGTGIYMVGGSNRLLANTFYNCTTAIDGQTGTDHVIINNTISSCTTGISYTSDPGDSTVVDYNNFYNNTADVSNISKGANTVAVDPSFVDAPNGNFALQAGSGLKEAGWSLSLGVS